MEKVALLFAGQGSQTIGMGKDFYDDCEMIQNLYKQASDLLGYDLTKILFDQNELINQTKYSQPSIVVTSVVIYEMLKKAIKVDIQAMAGFSLGEYSALYASGVFDFDTIIKLIQKRSSYMQEASVENQGGMAAVIGLEKEKLDYLCKEIGGVWIANYNCPNQLVVSGFSSSLEVLMMVAKEKGARRIVPLNVSGGFHTVLMKSAADKLYEDIKEVTLNLPSNDLYMNCTGKMLENTNDVPDLLRKQIYSPVYFEDIINNMIKNGITTFIEIGPGSVLSGFVKKIDASRKIITINKLNDLKQLEEICY